MVFNGLIMFLPFLVAFSILVYLEHEPKRDDLPPKKWRHEPIADRLYRRDIEPVFKMGAELIKQYFRLRFQQVGKIKEETWL